MTVLVYAGAVVGLVGLMIVGSRALGERHTEASTGRPYESGMPVTGTAQEPVAVPYFAVGLLFVVFDLETAYLIAWALVAGETDWRAYATVMFFVAVLLLVWAYVVRTGAFDWARPTRGGPEA